MGKVSELIGTVVCGQPEYDRTVDEECFNTIQVKFRGLQISVLYSALTCTSQFRDGTKIKVVGCLMSDVRKNKYPKFYIYAHSISEVDIDSAPTNLIYFSCMVNNVREYTTNSRCIDILPLVATDTSPIGTLSVLYLCARKGDARRLMNIEKGYTLEGWGYLKCYRDVYEICIMKITNLEEILTKD